MNVYPRETVQNPEFDAGIYGEGEYTTLELVRTLETNGHFNNIQGLIYKEDKDVVVNPSRALG